MKRWDLRRILPVLLAPIGALLLAAAISSLALMISGKDPFAAYEAMFRYAFGPNSGPSVTTDILNKATAYYLAALAVAIGFKMGLFNIGVDGQSRLAALAAGALGAASFLSWVPGVLRIVLIVIVAMAVGAAWAGVAALLKVYRGVSEVISTIMLNFIGGAIFAYLLTTERLGVKAPGGEIVSTPILPEDSWLSGFQLFPGTNNRVFDFMFVAIAAGIAYWFLLGRTRFGFDLRATGMNPSAAVASGVNAKRMVITTMLISGAVAGLVALPEMHRTRPRGDDIRAGARLHRHRDRPARPQQPGRHRARGAAVGVPGRVQPAAGPARHPQGDRGDHAGRHVARRGRGVRTGGPHQPPAAAAQRR